MPKFIIERDLPGAGELSALQLAELAQRSCAVLHELGTRIQWIHSYVTDDRIYCVYLASDEQLVITHARKAGFPADEISRIHSVIEPVTAEALSEV